MSTISTYVLDTSLGKPASGVPVMLERISTGGARAELGRGVTDADGRVPHLAPPGQPLTPGTYRLRFDTAVYFAATGRSVFYPSISVDFRVVAGDVTNHHVPLLLSPFGYSTYRGV